MAKSPTPQQPKSLILILSITGVIVVVAIAIYAMMYSSELSKTTGQSTQTDKTVIEAPEITSAADLDKAVDVLDASDIESKEEQELLQAKIKEFQE